MTIDRRYFYQAKPVITKWVKPKNTLRKRVKHQMYEPIYKEKYIVYSHFFKKLHTIQRYRNDKSDCHYNRQMREVVAVKGITAVEKIKID